jgi:hypothetical protein
VICELINIRRAKLCAEKHIDEIKNSRRNADFVKLSTNVVADLLPDILRMIGLMVFGNPWGIISDIPKTPIFKNISNDNRNARFAAPRPFPMGIVIENVWNISGSFGKEIKQSTTNSLTTLNMLDI